ncbi:MULTISPECIES: DUF2568 domain-containing protein [Bacillus]|uniref:DUF2568 domain-containing protein n=1 Tax=Bacillus TaxID=1386 RepID=UPI000367226D|nr:MULTISPECIES: DUF2568 domain-containing protein [Bacillus]
MSMWGIVFIRLMMVVICFIIVSFWGFCYGKNKMTRILLSIVVPFVIGYLGVNLVIPLSIYYLTGLNRLFLDLLLYSICFAALLDMGYKKLSLLFAITSLLFSFLIFLRIWIY